MQNIGRRNNKLISVIIPTYNRAIYICDAVDSVLSQTYNNYEIIVVDDGSTDNTESLITKYAGKVNYYRQTNQGVSAARNFGIEKSLGEYVAFLDSDDIWLPNKLEYQMALFDKYSDAGMIGGGCNYIDKNKNPVLIPTTPHSVIENEELEIYTALPGSVSNCLVKKAVLDDVGYFDPTLVLAEDRELWMRISRKYAVYAVTVPTVSIRIHDEVRPNRNLNSDLVARKTVNKTITRKIVRLKADAWMYFYFFTLWYAHSKSRSIYYLIMSFVHYPLPIHPKLNRRQKSAKLLLSDSIYTVIRKIFNQFKK